MLSIEKCRSILGLSPEEMADEALEEIRDTLYGLAELCFSNWHQNSFPAQGAATAALYAGKLPTSSQTLLRENPGR